MAKVARTEPGTTVNYGEYVFEFGDDGSRQVSDQEADILSRLDADGVLKVTITESKKRKES